MLDKFYLCKEQGVIKIMYTIMFNLYMYKITIHYITSRLRFTLVRSECNTLRSITTRYTYLNIIINGAIRLVHVQSRRTFVSLFLSLFIIWIVYYYQNIYSYSVECFHKGHNNGLFLLLSILGLSWVRL